MTGWIGCGLSTRASIRRRLRLVDSAAPSTRHPSQLLALAIGAVYTLIGILGFFITGFDNFAAETDKTLLGFEINPLHKLVHLAIGLAGLALWRGWTRPGPMAGCWPPATG